MNPAPTRAEDPQVEVSDPTPVVEHEDFPIVWADPTQAARLWMRDRMHWPDPVTPLAYDLLEIAFGTGAAAAAAAFYIHLGGFATARINTYFYAEMPAGPPPSMTPEALAETAAKSEAAFTGVLGRLGSYWEDELLPEIHDHLAFWDGFDLAGATTPELLVHLDETLVRFSRLFDIHFRAVFPAYLAVSELDECYQALLGEAAPRGRGVSPLPEQTGGEVGAVGAFDAYRLVGGFPSKTVEVGRELWRLSREALASPEVAATLLATAGCPSAEVFDRLGQSDAGLAFSARLRDYLTVYGQRGDKFFDLDRPAWIEEPGPVFDTLRSYLAQPDRGDPALSVSRLAEERVEAVTLTRERIAAYPAAARHHFEFLLTAAEAGVVITEDHGFWIDFQSAYKVRRVLVECGRRLVAVGVVDAVDDVFMLTLDELRAAAAEDSPARSRHELVSVRRAEMERFAAVRPPDFIGTPPAGPPPPLTPTLRASQKFMGRFGPPTADVSIDVEPGVVRGLPGSPGRVRGVARVIRVLADADRLRPGEILVTETTTPPWTPLFAVAAAMVTDTGGVLSHCAVVAREYGLPAVVGTGRGTDRIVDGTFIEVDGDTGTVLLPTDLG